MFLRIGGNWLTGIDESVALLLYCFIALLLCCSVSLRISERWTLNQTKTSSEWIKCENSSYRKSRERYPPSKCYFVGRSSFFAFRISHFAFRFSILDCRLSIFVSYWKIQSPRTIEQLFIRFFGFGVRCGWLAACLLFDNRECVCRSSSLSIRISFIFHWNKTINSSIKFARI